MSPLQQQQLQRRLRYFELGTKVKLQMVLLTNRKLGLPRMQNRESGSHEMTCVCGERTPAFVPLPVPPIRTRCSD